MSVTVNDILLDVSYRRGENGVPSGNEQTRRISFVSQAFRDLMRENKYWFHVTEYATQTDEDEEIYSLPTDYREFLEVRTDGLLRAPNQRTQPLMLLVTPQCTSPSLPITSTISIFTFSTMSFTCCQHQGARRLR